MQITLRYDTTKQFVDEHGWQELLEALDAKCAAISGAPLDIYQVSKDWYQDSQFILKGKGGRGDVIVRWV